MRGVGGPLLSIGDLLADLVAETSESPENDQNPDNSSRLDPDAVSGSLDLTQLFQVTLLIISVFFFGSEQIFSIE